MAAGCHARACRSILEPIVYAPPDETPEDFAAAFPSLVVASAQRLQPLGPDILRCSFRATTWRRGGLVQATRRRLRSDALGPAGRGRCPGGIRTRPAHRVRGRRLRVHRGADLVDGRDRRQRRGRDLAPPRRRAVAALAARHRAERDAVARARSRATGTATRTGSLRAGSKVAFVVGGSQASGSGSRLDDPVGTFSRAGIRSREAPGFARLFDGPRVAAGLAVGRPTASGRITAADWRTAGDSRPPNAPPLLKPVLRASGCISLSRRRPESRNCDLQRSRSHDPASTPSSNEREEAHAAYAILRRSGWRSPGDLQQAAGRSMRVGDEEMSGDIRWIRSYVLEEGGGSVGTVCIYEATSPRRSASTRTAPTCR